MIKIFLKHCIYEKCINLIFDGITKAFKTPELEYEILDVKNIGSKEIYTVKHKGKIYTTTLDNKKDIINALVRIYGLSIGAAEQEFHERLLYHLDCSGYDRSIP